MLQRLKLPAELDGKAWRYANPAGANRRHHHAELELNMVTRGTGTYLLGNRHYRIRRGDLLWLFPAQEHVLFEQTPDFEMWVVVFKRRMIKRVATDAKARALLQKNFVKEACRRLKQTDLVRFEELFARLAEDIAGPELVSAGLVNAGLAYALLQAWRCFEHAGEVPVREIHPAVEQAARLMLGEASDWGLDALAARVELSSSRLSRLFKQQTGSSIVEFRNRQRMERFLSQYEDATERPTLLEAALEAGFGSYPQFHRVFRQVVGCSPGEYQRRQRT